MTQTTFLFTALKAAASTPRHGTLVISLICILQMCALHAQSGEDDFEDAEDVVPVETVLPPGFLHSAHFTIDAEVFAENNFFRFSVEADNARYEVTSIAMLRKRLYEISTIAEVQARLAKTPDSTNRAHVGRRGVDSEYVVDILADPVNTAGQLLSNIQYNVDKTLNPGKASARGAAVGARDVAQFDLNPSAHKRAAAAQLGVDVYSTNPHLQRILNSVAEARSAGKTASSFSPLIRDPYATPDFGSGVLRTRLDSLIKNIPGNELHEQIDARLRALSVPSDTRIGFLTNPAYTPRTRLYFTQFASMLDAVRNLDFLFAAASSAVTEADALAYVNYARMLAHVQLHQGNLTEVITNTRFPTLGTSDGNAVLALPLDYLAWTAAVAAAAGELRGIRQRHQLQRFIVLLAGTPSKRASQELANRAVDIVPNYSF